MPELSLDDLAIFVRVVEQGGFASAARELGTPTSTVSRAIERLEEQSGVRLLQRTTRTVKPTAEGRDLYVAVAPSVAALRGAARAVEPAAKKPKGRLRVTAAADLGASFLSTAIVGFTERYPHVQLDFVLTNRHSNLIDEGFDVALRAAAKLGDSSLVARKLGDLEHRLYASPEYLQKVGAPASPDHLAEHRCVVFRGKDLARTWALRDASGAVREIPIRGTIGGDDFAFVRGIILAGGGIGLLPHVNASGDESSGRLVRVLPEFHARGAALHIVYPSTKNLPARVTAFRDFVIEAYDAWSARGSIR